MAAGLAKTMSTALMTRISVYVNVFFRILKAARSHTEPFSCLNKRFLRSLHLQLLREVAGSDFHKSSLWLSPINVRKMISQLTYMCVFLVLI